MSISGSAALLQFGEVCGPALIPLHCQSNDHFLSLRTATQVNGVSLTREERFRLLRALSEVGVTSFQISMGVNSRGYTGDQMAEEVKICKSLNPDAEVDIDPLIHGTIDPSVFGNTREKHIGSITRKRSLTDDEARTCSAIRLASYPYPNSLRAVFLIFVLFPPGAMSLS